MRKGQVKLLNNASKNGFSESILQVLRDEDSPLCVLRNIYDTIYYFRHENLTKDEIKEYMDIFDALELGRIYGLDYHVFRRTSKTCCEVTRILKQVPVAMRNKGFDILFGYLFGVCVLCDLDDFDESILVDTLTMIADTFNCYYSLYNTTFKTFADYLVSLRYQCCNADIRYNQLPMFLQCKVTAEELKTFGSYASIAYHRTKHAFPCLTNKLLKYTENDKKIKIRYDDVEEWVSDKVSDLLPQLDVGMSLTVNGSPIKMVITYGLTNIAVQYNFGKSYSYHRYADDLRFYCQYGKPPVSNHFKIYFDGRIYNALSANKMVPMTLRDFVRLYHVRSLTAILDEYIDKQIDCSPIWKDIKAFCLSMKEHTDIYCYIPPVAINEISPYHNLNDLMRGIYKTADFVNWNHCNLTYGYSLMKWRSKITPESFCYLTNKATDRSNWYFDLFEYLKHNVEAHPESWIVQDDGVPMSENARCEYITDCLRMCNKLHKKVNVKMTSMKKIKDLHDSCMFEATMKKTPKITIPKNSKFKALRKQLPDDFEWITTRKRIVAEYVMQHHCVASYADYINADYCAIYSLVQDGIRYTIEFRQTKKGSYQIAQLRGVCNHSAPTEVWDYVHQCLKGV